MITYRDSHDVELPLLAALHEACGFSERSRKTLAGQVEGAKWIVAAYDGARLVGFARAISDGVKNAYISTVMVDTEYRRRGIARELLRRLIAGRDEIRWVLHTSEAARPFYAAIGFTSATDMLWYGRR